MANLSGTRVELRTAEAKLNKFAASKGIAYIIAPDGGHRTYARTRQLLQYRDDAVKQARTTAAAKAKAAGKSPADQTAAGNAAAKAAHYRVSAPEDSFHTIGSSFDIKIVIRPAGMSLAQAYKVLGDYAPTIGLVWGGTFSAPADIYHFQLAGTRAENATAYAAALGSGVPALLAASVKASGPSVTMPTHTVVLAAVAATVGVAVYLAHRS